MKLRIFQQFLSHENQGHAGSCESEDSGESVLSTGRQTVRVVLVRVGDDSALAVELSGLVVVLRVNDAAEAEVGLEMRGDVGNVGFARGTQ